ncbi:MAG: CYTH domain-containing protein [Candidatus Aenigmatarchaeota archaeon]
MKSIELERTFLAKFLPPDLKNCQHKEIVDIYIPKSDRHPSLRIRKNGERFEITKKFPVETSASMQNENTIKLTEEEFLSLSKISGKVVRKIRYFYKYDKFIAEIDVFQDALWGLVIIDFEFDSKSDQNSFQMPDFCLVDVTDEEFIAGGMLCGKSYSDIEDNLRKFDYKKIDVIL